MNPQALVRRVAAMDRGELRFRAMCEARKAAGRVRFTLARPAWRRPAVVCLLDPSAGPLVREARDVAARGDFLTAHRILGRHFAARAPRWPVAAVRREALSQQIHDTYPAAAMDARDRADRIVDGHYDLLGYTDLELGNPPDWRADAVHRRRAPGGFWSGIRFLDPAAGDHKVIWEVNRHQHFLWLGTAFWLTGRRIYRDTFIAHLEDWMRANPPLEGINWASMLELAFRALSWTWAVEFFAADAAADEVPWLVDLLVALDRQLVHIEDNLSTYFSPNTHVSGEALALYAVSRAFPELLGSAARAAHGRSILQREAAAQVRSDGGHAELSSHYHRYSTDFYLLAHLVAAQTGEPAGLFAGPLRAQARYLRAIADDRGRLPHVGDEDGGQLFRFGGVPSEDASATLSAAASVLDEAALAVSAPTPEVQWILGAAPMTAPTRPHTWPSQVLTETGYVVLRQPDRRGYLLFDAGRHGFLNGGHAHADALSVVVSAAGEPLFVDAGTPTYTMDAEVRDRFRSPAMHNTVTIDGAPFAQPRGPFHWSRYADARLLAARVDGDLPFAVGMHQGYGFPVMRSVLSVAGEGWLIVDSAASPGRVRLDSWWRLHPLWSAAAVPTGFTLAHVSGARLSIATTASDRDIVASDWSPDYGRIEPTSVLRITESGAGPVVGTFMRLAHTDVVPAITLVESRADLEGWTSYTFAIASDREMRISVALPTRAEAQPIGARWPQPCIQERRAVCVE